jgi:hypothetical protein
MHSSTITKTPGDLGFKWWQVLGSNQRRLSRRFYIPEGAGWGKGVVCPFFFRFRPGFGHAGRKAGVKVERPGWTNDLDAGLSSGSRWRGRERYGVVGGARPVRSSCPWAGSRLRSSLRVCPRLAAAGAWGGFACGQRDQSDSRPARRGRGPVKPAITRCPRPGPAHAACRAAAARDRTWPSRMA